MPPGVTGHYTRPVTRPPTPTSSGAGHSGSGYALMGVLMVVLTLVGWSSVPLFVTHFSQSIDVWTQNGWRYAFSAVLWAPVLVWAYARRSMPANLWRASLVPSIANALGQAAFTWSFYNVDTTTATFGLRMQIVFLAVGAYLMFPSERALLRRPLAWVGMFMVLGGIIGTIILRDPAHDVMTAVGGSNRPLLGVLVAVVSGLLFACYALAVRKYMHGYHPLTAFAAISQITALLSVVMMVALAKHPVTRVHDFGWSVWMLDGGQLLLLGLSSVIGIGLGHTFYYISIARLGVAVTSGVLQLQPFCVAVLRFALMGVLMTAGQWVSGSVAVGGAMVLLWAQWSLTRRGGATTGQEASRMPPVAGAESEGVEAAEMDAIPVQSDGPAGHHAARESCGNIRRHAK